MGLSLIHQVFPIHFTLQMIVFPGNQEDEDRAIGDLPALGSCHTKKMDSCYTRDLLSAHWNPWRTFTRLLMKQSLEILI